MLKTSRLNLRPFLPEDLPLLYQLHSNPEVGKTTIDGVQTLETTSEHLENFIAHQEKFGYSQMAVFENKTGKFIGRAGFTNRTLTKEIGEQTEIRFAFLPEFWGQGYASETSKALVEFAFKNLKLKTLAAICAIFNEKSAQVLTKSGFYFVKNIAVEGYDIEDEAKYYLQNSK
jgi:RimJ/RimL family protein N-acetyltransferase